MSRNKSSYFLHVEHEERAEISLLAAVNAADHYANRTNPGKDLLPVPNLKPHRSAERTGKGGGGAGGSKRRG